MAANPFVFPNLRFDPEKDLDPVQLIGTASLQYCENAPVIGLGCASLSPCVVRDR